jgi:hypothetical protein
VHIITVERRTSQEKGKKKKKKLKKENDPPTVHIRWFNMIHSALAKYFNTSLLFHHSPVTSFAVAK